MTGTIWSPDGPITSTANADNSYKAQRYTATAGQTVFTLTEFVYAVGTGSLLVFVNGVDQFITTDFLETDSSHVTFTTALSAGDVVVIRGLIGSTGAQAAQASADQAAQSAIDAANIVVTATAEVQVVIDAGIADMNVIADAVDASALAAAGSAAAAEDSYQAIIDLGLPSLPLGISNGGTGQTTKALAFKALAPTPEVDKVIGSLDGINFAMLPKGTADLVRVLRSSNTMLVATDISKYFVCTLTFIQTFDTPANLGNGWFCYIKNAGTGNIVIGTYEMYPGEERRFDCDGTTVNSIVITPFYITRTSSSIFYKPPGYSAFGGLLFGGGASGRASRQTPAAGQVVGGGGAAACIPIWYPNASMPASVSFVIGAGGLGVSATSLSGTNGNDGGNSTFGSFVAYGGVAGNDGGSISGAGTLSKAFADPIFGYSIGGAPAGGHYKMIFATRSDSFSDSTYGGGGAGECRPDGAGVSYINKGGNSVYGGAGTTGCYGDGVDFTTSATAGNSMYGGIPGQNIVLGAAAAIILLNIGTSIYGGAGGAAAAGTGVRTGTAGGVRGGGGGAAFSTDNNTATSGAGGRGELQLWGIL